MRYLLDTNLIFEVVSKRPDRRVLNWVDTLHPSQVYLSVVTIGEIQKGIARLRESNRRRQLEEWLRDDLLVRFSGQILVIDVYVGLTWGELVAELERIGRPMPAIDSLVAALARHHDVTLATRNDVDFKNAGIRVVNPWTG